jgi:hypothetical protein
MTVLVYWAAVSWGWAGHFGIEVGLCKTNSVPPSLVLLLITEATASNQTQLERL